MEEDIQKLKIGMVIYVGVLWVTYLFFGYIVRHNLIGFVTALIALIDCMLNNEERLEFHFNQETLYDKAGDKLKKVYEALQQKNRRIENEKNKTEEMISDISHQIKTPLSNLKMYHQLLHHPKISIEKQLECHDIIGSQIEKLDFLTDTMIKMSRLEKGLIDLKGEVKDVYNTVEKAVESILPKANKKNIQIKLPDKKVWKVFHDEKWTAEALFNLLENAVKYTSDNGCIEIEIESLEVITLITVADTGRGIKEENYERIFQRFFREEEVQAMEGSGIGLYLTREIIHRQKGYIKASSKYGEGSTFKVALPNIRM